MKRKHIDDVQPPTIREHLNMILSHKNLIDLEMKNMTPEDLPDWYDEKLYKEAQKFYMRNIMAISLCNFKGFIMILSIPSILKVLVYTKQNHTYCLAYKRYSRTMCYLYDMYVSNPSDPKSALYKMLTIVRLKHKTNNKKSNDHGIGGIYEKDLVLTQFIFVALVMIAAKPSGIRAQPEELKAFNHFWRVIGYMLGIPDRINLCRKNFAETRELCQLLSAVFVDNLNNPPLQYNEIIANGLDRAWCLNITINKDAIMALTYKIIDAKYKKPLGWYSWINMKYHEYICDLFLVPYIGTIVRVYFNIVARLNHWYLRKCPILAWILYGKKESQISLYPKYADSME